jgi:hypothetical protein
MNHFGCLFKELLFDRVYSGNKVQSVLFHIFPDSWLQHSLLAFLSVLRMLYVS